jgi:hypothetical protein
MADGWGIVWLVVLALVGRFGWGWVVVVVALGFLWDAVSVTGRVRNAVQRRRQSQTPHQWELGNAGRGAGLLALLALGGWLLGWPVGDFLSAAWAAVKAVFG